MRFRLSAIFVAVTLTAMGIVVCTYRAPIGARNAKSIREINSVPVEPYQRVEWSPDRKRLALYTPPGPVMIYDSLTLLHVQTIGADRRITKFAFSFDPSIVAIAENEHSAVILNLTDDTTRVIETGVHEAALKFSPDSQFLLTSGYRTDASLWSVEDGTLVRTYAPAAGASYANAVFSSDGQLLAVADSEEVTLIYETQSGKLLHTLPKRYSRGLAFDQSGQRLAVAYTDGTVGCWDVKTGKLIKELKAKAQELFEVDWSPNGELIAAGGRDGKISLWSSNDYQELKRIDGGDYVSGLRFIPGGRGLVTVGSEKGTFRRLIKVWAVRHALTRVAD